MYVCQVGRVTPCAPLGERIRVCGAHGVTRPTLLALRRAGALGCNEISVLSYWAHDAETLSENLRRALEELRGARDGFQNELPPLDRRGDALVRAATVVLRGHLHAHRS